MSGCEGNGAPERSIVKTTKLVAYFERLKPEEIAYLEQQLHSVNSAKARKNHRDAALRERAALLGDWRPSRVAQYIEVELRNYLVWAWPKERLLTELPPGTPRVHVLLHAMLRWNNGRVLKQRQIINVMDGCRGG